jgi:hypothetical protein
MATGVGTRPGWPEVGKIVGHVLRGGALQVVTAANTDRPDAGGQPRLVLPEPPTQPEVRG